MVLAGGLRSLGRHVGRTVNTLLLSISASAFKLRFRRLGGSHRAVSNGQPCPSRRECTLDWAVKQFARPKSKRPYWTCREGQLSKAFVAYRLTPPTAGWQTLWAPLIVVARSHFPKCFLVAFRIAWPIRPRRGMYFLVAAQLAVKAMASAIRTRRG